MRRAPLPFLCAALLVAGCATPPPAEEGPEEALPPAEAEGPEKAPEEGPAEEPATPPPAAEPRPWVVKLDHGHALAIVDGVRVYLDAPAKQARRAKEPAASWLDRKATLGPLLDARSKPLVRGRPFRICLDPGHGGSDPGARSGDGRTVEAALTLDVADRVRRLLEADGFEVVPTRRDGATDQTLEERAAKARRGKADAFVSIHFNTNPGSASARGLETYVFPARGMESTSYSGRRPSPESSVAWRGLAGNEGSVQLGFCIHRRLLAATRLPDRGLRRARWIVLREATVPAVLVECGFLTSAKDLAYLRTEAGRAALARGLYEGICDFAFGTMAPGLPARTPENASAPPPASATDPATPLRRPPTVDFVRDETLRGPRTDLPAPPDDPATRGAREAALRAAGLAP